MKTHIEVTTKAGSKQFIPIKDLCVTDTFFGQKTASFWFSDDRDPYSATPIQESYEEVKLLIEACS